MFDSLLILSEFLTNEKAQGIYWNDKWHNYSTRDCIMNAYEWSYMIKKSNKPFPIRDIFSFNKHLLIGTVCQAYTGHHHTEVNR